MTKREAFMVLFEPEEGWTNDVEVSRAFARFNREREGLPVEYCAACGAESEGGSCCVACGFGWDDIKRAVGIVEVVATLAHGELGASQKRKAIDFVLGEITDPGFLDSHADGAP
jgi:hypothetical protein